MTGVLAGKRVLLLEDELLIAIDAEAILYDLGASDVLLAHSVDEAWSRLGNGSFDCAMLDRNLNGEYSDDFARELAARDIPLILATGYGPIAGIQDTVTVAKPYDERMIAEAFREALSRRAK